MGIGSFLNQLNALDDQQMLRHNLTEAEVKIRKAERNVSDLVLVTM